MKLGTNDIGSVYLGTNEISKVYLGTNLVWESAFDADYQSVLDYATTQGYTLPSASQQALQNQLVVDLKAAGIWSKLDTFAVFATDGDEDFALIDWKRLIYYSGVSSPIFGINQGFKTDYVASYINTNYNVLNDAVNTTDEDFSIATYFYNAPNTGDAFGCRVGTLNKDITIIPTRYRLLSSIQISPSNATPSFLIQGKTGLTTAYAVAQNTKNDLTITSNANSIRPNLDFLVTAVNNNSSILYFGGGNVPYISFVAIGSALYNESIDFENAFNNYIASI